MTPRTWFLVLFVALSLLPHKARSTTDDDQFREDVILCEEAVAHLESCCPSATFDNVACKYYFNQDDCGDDNEVTLTLPAYSIPQSNCLRNASCADLVASGACASPPDAGAVCP
ncbi:MAG: hypothetical protein FWD17_16220 [Polyangiaceae bacterium]|nr:hypothetical protein [Polyangiaceae bacterium]